MNLGYLKYLFTGIIPDTAYMFLNIGRFLCVKDGIERLSSQLGPPSDHIVKQRIGQFLLKNAGRL